MPRGNTLDHPGFRITHHVIVLIVLGQRPGRYDVGLVVLARHQCLVNSPLTVPETDLPVVAYSRVNRIHIGINAVVGRFDPVADVGFAVEIPGVVFTCERPELADQLL